MTIDEICEKYEIKNYTINDDGTIDVNGRVDLYSSGLKEFPLTFNRVDGDFFAQNNGLKTLKGSPRWVSGYFDVANNSLTNLEGCPDYVGSDFSCTYNHLTSLNGSPDYVGDDFYCGYNDLTDLVGSPKEIGHSFYCDENEKLINPKGVSEKIGSVFICNDTPLSSIFDEVDQHFLYTFNFYKIIKDDTVNLKRLKYVMDLYDKPIDLEEIQKYYRIV
jgi:hypothetical protein